MLSDFRFWESVALAVILSVLFRVLIKKLRGKMPPVSSSTAITLRLGALVFAVWLVCMGVLTLGVAQYVLSQLSQTGVNLAQQVCQRGRLDELSSQDSQRAQLRSKPGAVEYAMNLALASSGVDIRPPDNTFNLSHSLPTIFRNSNLPCTTAVRFLDSGGSTVRESGRFLYFGYVPQELWQSGQEDATGYAWIDLNDTEDNRYLVFQNIYDVAALRLTGCFDGSRFEPYAMDLLTDGFYFNALDQAPPPKEPTADADSNAGNPSYTISQLDAMGLLTWDARFDRTASAEQPLVTIYATYPQMNRYTPGSPVTYRGSEHHENLLALLETMDDYRDMGRDSFYSSASQFDLWNLVVFSSWKISIPASSDEEGNLLPAAEYTVLTALRASPLGIAAQFLTAVYLATFLLALLGLLFVRSSLKAHLITPLRDINQGIDTGWSRLDEHPDALPDWKEVRLLKQHYARTQDTLNANKNEIARLTAALDYAKTAEENRRQMTSNLAHELKTPLAIIHSYAEGLKEHIAEEKREKYLNVILRETERTDHMVLEMLDLSRLEAGRVKLSRDEFSLIALTRSIFEKLERAAEAKSLQIQFFFPSDFTVTADESRIAQVIENFATNAVKYTPVGGHISVRIGHKPSETIFIIENESPPLSAEALRKVWDTFYRADEARTSGGTGLGLAIAKNIIELHGGRCSVRNTASGVAFQFII